MNIGWIICVLAALAAGIFGGSQDAQIWLAAGVIILSMDNSQ